MSGAWGQAWGPAWGPAWGWQSSDPVQDVLDRYSALTNTETVAISNFVQGLVDAGIWHRLTEVYLPALNDTDWQIGMKQFNLTVFGAPVHTFQLGVDLADDTEYLHSGAQYDTYATVTGIIGAYVVQNAAPPAGATDYWGFEPTAGAWNGLRYRGSDDDWDVRYNTGAIPRFMDTSRPDEGLILVGFDGTNAQLRKVDGSYHEEARTAGTFATGQTIQWHGKSQDGVSIGVNMRGSRYDLMLEGNGAFTEEEFGIIGTRALSLLNSLRPYVPPEYGEGCGMLL